MSKRTSIWGVILGFIVVGCGDGEQRSRVGVLRGNAPEAAKESAAELQRKRAMQAITVKSEASHALYDLDDYNVSITRTLQVECFRAAYGTSANPDCVPPEAPSGVNVCTNKVRVDMCVAAALIDLAKGNDAILPNFWGNGFCEEPASPVYPDGVGPYRVMPLNPAQKVQILADARWRLVNVLQTLAYELAWWHCRDSENNSFEATSAMVDAYQALEESTDLAVEAELAVADSEMSSTPDTALAIKRAISSPLYSHASAVAWLVGGAAAPDAERLFTFPGAGDGFCSLPRLSPPAEVALSAIREAAPAPATVLAIPANPLVPTSSEIGIDDFLNRRGLMTGSILERLERVWNTTITEPDIAARLGVDQKAFIDAREYLAQEIRAFARPLDQYSGPSEPAQFRAYTATAAPPGPRSSAYYAAIARSAPGIVPGWPWYVDRAFQDSDCQTDMNFLTFATRGYGLDRIRDNMMKYVECIESWESGTVWHVAPLAAIRESLQQVRKETIQHAYHMTSGIQWDNQVVRIASGAVVDRGYRVVRGEAALECLTRGTIDGLSCATNASDGQPGGPWNVCDLEGSPVPTCTFGPPAESGVTWYVLRSREAANWTIASGNQPGHWDTAMLHWEPVTGFQPGGDPNYAISIDSQSYQTRTIPVYSDIEERVAKILAPSRSWCTKPERNCLGMREDDPIPLENELSTDGDSTENSWKYYLNLAKDAAAKSDDLAQQYFDASLSVDQLKVDQDRYELNKQEQAAAKLEELQRICGSGIVASDLLDAMGVLPSDFNMNSLYQGSCVGDERSATSIYDCIHGARLVSIPKLVHLHPALQSLMYCVADMADGGNSVDLVHLGDADLCVPDEAISNSCGGENGACPATKVASSTAPQCPTGFTLVPKQNGLAFFQTLAEGTMSDGAAVCSDFREQRKYKKKPIKASLETSPTLSNSNMHEVAQSLHYEAQAGGYVIIRGPGGTLFNTGSTASGPASGGLACSQTVPASCANGTGIACTATDCSDETQRAAMNDRLYNAFVAAKLVTARNDDKPFQVMVPSYTIFNTEPNDVTSDQIIQFKTATTSLPLRRKSSSRWQQFTDDSGGLVNAKMWLGKVTAKPGGTATDWLLTRDDMHFESYSLPENSRMKFAFQIRDIKPTFNDGAKLMFNGLGCGTTSTHSGNDGCAIQMLQNNIIWDKCKSPYYKFERDFSFGWADGEHFTGIYYNGDTKYTTFNSDSSKTERQPFGDSCKGGGWANTNYCLRDPASGKVDSAQDLADSWNEAIGGNGYPLAFSTAISLGMETDAKRNVYLDAIEMLCEASAQAGGAVDCGAAPPPLRTVDDLGQTGEYLQCLGRKISAKGATAVFKGIPKAVLDPLRGSTGTVYESATGEIGQQLEELKIALLATYKTQQTIGHVIRQFGSEMKALQATMRSYVAQDKINDVQFEATQVRETTSCIAAVSSLAGMNTYFNPGSVGAAAANCANSIAQIKFADQMRDLQKEDTGAQTETAIARFNQSFDEKAQILDSQSTELSEALYRVNQAIGRVNSLRIQAFRILADGIWLLSNDSKATSNVRVATDSRRAIFASRYKSALENAKRLAFLARRAVEQRLGIHLDNMMEDLPLVEAPARWESALCFGAYPGLDYKWLSSSNKKTTATDDLSVTGGFIGDYVTKLANVVESYQLVNGFQDGKDTAVVSLRDDILGIRKPCLMPSRNLLASTDDLTPSMYGSLAAGKGWYVTGCNESLAENVAGQSPTNCLSVSRDNTTIRPGGAEVDVPVWRLAFGGGTSDNPCNGVTSGSCGWQTSARLAQTVHLEQGSYALTWYQQKTSDSDESIVEAYIPTNAALTVVRASQPLGQFGTNWVKKIAIFSLTSAADIEIGFIKGATTPAGASGKNPAIWAAPMLEAITDEQLNVSPWYDISVGKYEMTNAAGQAQRTSCEDRDGEVFRTKWTPGCAYLCPDGYSTNCAQFAKPSCYREIAFPMSQWGVESNQQFVQSGFARGNFNYRINQVGLNFVGTNLRNCDASELPQSCYSGGFVTYSLTHEGPYAVRNHQGTDFIASLFEGKIEHARGVAAERYITNPVSSTDKTLLDEYMRGEMSGRPLSGTFVLRVWDDPNLDFNAIEDVQIVLKYGYWTRLAH